MSAQNTFNLSVATQKCHLSSKYKDTNVAGTRSGDRMLTWFFGFNFISESKGSEQDFAVGDSEAESSFV